MNIKPELQEDYDKYVEVNNQDPYSQMIVKAGHIFGYELDQMKTCDEAEAKVMSCNEELGGLSGEQFGAVVSTHATFHERGDEVEQWWRNKHAR